MFVVGSDRLLQEWMMQRIAFLIIINQPTPVNSLPSHLCYAFIHPSIHQYYILQLSIYCALSWLNIKKKILQTLITDLDPDQRVKNAMNEINSSKRLKFAVAERAEGDKILQVKSAEAGAEALYLSGVGVSRQRKAIVDGLRER